MPLSNDTDRDWENFGSKDPYFGVLTLDKFRKANLTEQTKEEFFRSGGDYIEDVLAKIRKHIDPAFSPQKVLDFGCGVGRLVVPLASIAQRVVGVDVSPSMLDEAGRNCAARAIANVEFLRSDDALSQVSEKFDLIHSFIVFQHIPTQRGERIFEKLMGHMEEGSVCAIQFTYAKSFPVNKFVYWAKRHVPFARNIIALLRGRGFFAIEMQMNNYDMNRVLLLMQKNGVREFHAEYTDHWGELGILLLFARAAAGSARDKAILS